MDDLDSESQLSRLDNNDLYIKKHINPVNRGDSAIFGDPVVKEEYDIFMNSPEVSQQDEEGNEDRSKLELDLDKS